jgi:hypothetical protein
LKNVEKNVEKICLKKVFLKKSEKIRKIRKDKKKIENNQKNNQ